MSGNNIKKLKITREFDAPRELLWEVFTKEEHLAKWWGPKGFEMKVAKLDLRPDGMFHYSMKSPDGNIMWGKFIYKEIVKPERLTLINSFSDENGNTTPNPWIVVWPLEILNHWTLTEIDGKTTLTIEGEPINASEDEIKAYEDNASSMQQGFQGTFNQLDEYLKQIK